MCVNLRFGEASSSSFPIRPRRRHTNFALLQRCKGGANIYSKPLHWFRCLTLITSLYSVRCQCLTEKGKRAPDAVSSFRSSFCPIAPDATGCLKSRCISRLHFVAQWVLLIRQATLWSVISTARTSRTYSATLSATITLAFSAVQKSCGKPF